MYSKSLIIKLKQLGLDTRKDSTYKIRNILEYNLDNEIKVGDLDPLELYSQFMEEYNEVLDLKDVLF